MRSSRLPLLGALLLAAGLPAAEAPPPLASPLPDEATEDPGEQSVIEALLEGGGEIEVGPLETVEVRAEARKRRRPRIRRVRLGYGVGYGLGLGPGDLERNFLEDPFADLLEELEEERRLDLGGFLSTGLVRTRSGRGSSGLGVATRYTGAHPDRTLFTLPQASLSADARIGLRAQVHLQLDFRTDPSNALGGGAQLNEAYVLLQDVPQGLSLRLGGYSPPLASWEVNGPFLTLNDTITHSAVNSPLEAGRVQGVELTNALHARPGRMRISAGLFQGGDTPVSGGHAPAFGVLHDGLGLGSLSGGNTGDDGWGWFLDLEGTPTRERRQGWRLSFLDAGGDPGAANPSREQTLWQVGAWREQGPWRFQFQGAEARTVNGRGPLDRTDSRALSVLANRRLDPRTTATLRFDRFQNHSPGQRDRGHAWTLAWNRMLGKQAMVQLEWLRPVHLPDPDLGRGDVADDLLQIRFMTWF